MPLVNGVVPDTDLVSWGGFYRAGLDIYQVDYGSSLAALTTGYVPTCEAPSHDISDTAALPHYPETARAATTPAGVKISRLTIEYHCTTWQGQRCVAIWGVRARAWPRRHEDSACLFLRPPEPIGTYQWRAFYQISGPHRKGGTGLLGGLKMREIK